MSEFNLTEEQQDCFEELINISMGKASDQLARYLDTFIELKVPSIESINATELVTMLTQQKDRMAMVSQGFFGDEGIRGESLISFQENDSANIAELLGYRPGDISQDEPLIDLSAILTTTFINVLSTQIDNQMLYNAPKLLPNTKNSISEHLQKMTFNWDLALKINIHYKVTDYAFTCNMILLIPKVAINNIKQVLDRILEELA